MKNKDGNHDEEFIYEEDRGAVLVKKLRAKLKKCEEEKKEYLDGWQRLKAESVNNKKEESERLNRANTRGAHSVLSEIIPVLDSFDMAFKGEGWDTVDDTWKKGVEHLHSQLEQVLQSHNIETIGKIGETFDPNVHEAVEERDSKRDESNIVLEVLRKGYKSSEETLRPARVVVSK